MHGFQSGDTVTFKEVNGMIGLNGRQNQIEGKHMRSTFISVNLYVLCHQSPSVGYV